MTARARTKCNFREASLLDVPHIVELERSAWGDKGATADTIAARIDTFREGNILAVDHDSIVGYLALQFVDDLTNASAFTWTDATGGGKIVATHSPDGEYMYGLNL